MSNIRADISAACADLDAVTEALAAVSSPGTLPTGSREFFDRLPSYSAQLTQVLNLIRARDAALEAVESFPKQIDPDNPLMFMYNGVSVPFWLGRLLVLQNYLATGWSIYDNLSKIAGVLSAKIEKPAKLQEDFLSSSNVVGTHTRDHLRRGYGWPIGISYAIRNWVLHDGNSQDGVELFKYSTHDKTAPYQLSDDGWSKIIERCVNKYKLDDTLTRLNPFPAINDDLVGGLIACHTEVDEAIGFILLSTTGGIKLQAQMLFRRDS